MGLYDITRIHITDPDEELSNWADPHTTIYTAEIDFLGKVVRFPAVPITFDNIVRIAKYITAKEGRPLERS